MALTNYLCDRNPRQLPKPPAWWLRQLADFDPQLVVMTSMHGPEYLLCRRWREAQGLTTAVHADSDSARCVTHRLLPITRIPHDVPWGQWMFAKLRGADLWEAGGADRYDAHLGAVEAEVNAKKEAAMGAAALDRGSAAYDAYQRRSGARITLPGETPESASSPVSPAADAADPPPSKPAAGMCAEAQGVS